MADYKILNDAVGENIVYVRKLDRAELPAEIREQTTDMDQIYAIHDPNGQVLALVDDRKKAFNVARMNERQPVSVH